MLDFFDSNVFLLLLLQFLPVLALVLGSAIASSPNEQTQDFLSISLGFSAGVMIYVSFVEIFFTRQKMR
jgi:ZIP family zinc transporter